MSFEGASIVEGICVVSLSSLSDEQAASLEWKEVSGLKAALLYDNGAPVVVVEDDLYTKQWGREAAKALYYLFRSDTIGCSGIYTC